MNFYIYKNRDSYVFAALLFIAAIMLFANIYQHKTILSTEASGNKIKILTQPSSINLPQYSKVNFWVTTNRPLAFANMQVLFDPTKVRLIRSPNIGRSIFSSHIKITSVEEANHTGIVDIIVAVDPKHKNNSPSGTFLLSAMHFAPATKAKETSILKVNISKSQFVSLDASVFEVSSSETLFKLNNSNSSRQATPAPPQLQTSDKYPRFNTLSDLSFWANKLGTITTQGKADGDYNGDNIIDGIDYIKWMSSSPGHLTFTSKEPEVKLSPTSIPHLSPTRTSDRPTKTPTAFNTKTPSIPTKRPTSIIISPTYSLPSPTPDYSNPQGQVFWRGDAETGNLNQWTTNSAPQISIESGIVAEGRYSYKFTMPSNYISPHNKHAVWLHQRGREISGTERFYSWQTFIPTDYPTNTDWSLLMQFKGEQTGSPPLALGYKNNQWQVNNNPRAGTGNNVTLGSWPATKGRWEQFVFHIKWSPDPKVGFVEVWHNGHLVLEKQYVSTIHTLNGSPVENYCDLGIYRGGDWPTDVTFYHDGFTTGSTFDSVKPW